MPVERTPPKVTNSRDRSLSARPEKRKLEHSAEKERKSRSTSKSRQQTDSSSKVNKRISLPQPSKPTSQVKTLTKPVKPPTDTHCGKCDTEFNDNCVLCECCKYWYHAACVDLTAGEIAAFTLLGPKAHWYCERCDAGAKELYMQHVEFKTRLDKIEKTVSDVKAEHSAMNSDISKLQEDATKDREDIEVCLKDNKAFKIITASNTESIKYTKDSIDELKTDINNAKTQQAVNTEKLNNLNTIVRNEVSEIIKTQVEECIKEINLDRQFPLLPTRNDSNEPAPPAVQEKITQFRKFVNEQCAERDEILKRKQQLMIFNLKEAATPEADKQQTHELLNLLNIDEENTIENMTRMGKSREGKHKPIRITLGNLSTKRKILASAPKLREVPEGDRFAKVYIKPNLTVNQWKESKNLMENLRVRRLAEPNKTMKIFKGKIIVVPNNQ